MNKNITLYNPCISIYLPTQKKLDKKFKARHRIQFMHVIGKIEKQLILTGIDNYTIQTILRPAREILGDHKFWTTQEESLVIFMAEDFFEYYQLPVPTELAVSIDSEFNVARLASMMENTPLHKTDMVKQRITQFRFSQKIA